MTQLEALQHTTSSSEAKGNEAYQKLTINGLKGGLKHGTVDTLLKFTTKFNYALGKIHTFLNLNSFLDLGIISRPQYSKYLNIIPAYTATSPR
jgi:hypothetical protein